VKEGLTIAYGFVETAREVEARPTGGNRMRKAVVMLLVVALLAGVLGSTPVRAAEDVVVQITIGSTKATINFKQVVLDQPPIIENGRTLVPFRFIGEALGAKIGWDPVKKTVSYVLGNKNIVLTIGSVTAIVNGAKTILDVAPKILPTGRTVVPLRFVSENIGAKVDWNSTTRMVTVTVSSTPGPTIKIGVALPLTAGSAEIGTQINNAAKLAVKDINAAGGVNGRMIELVPMDDQSDPKQAVNIANLFVTNKDIMACVADYNSSCTLAAAPIYNSAHLVHLCFSTSPAVTDAGPYTFRVWNSDAYIADFCIQLVLKAGYKKIGILYQLDDFGLGSLKVLLASLAKVGLKPLAVEGFIRGETKDFNTTITKMKGAGCEAVYCVANEAELCAFATQSGQQGWKPFISSGGTYYPGVIELGGKWVEGMVGMSFFDPSKMPDKVLSFFNRYDAEYSKTGAAKAAGASGPCAYDSIYMVADAIRSGAKTREDVQKYLANLKGFVGIVGTLSFDANGDMKIPVVPIVIKDGAYVLYTGN